MGQKKIEIKKIEGKAKRKMSLDKRQRGLINKVYEFSVLCDIDTALIICSEDGQLLQHYCNQNIVNLLSLYISSTPERRTQQSSEHLQLKLHDNRASEAPAVEYADLQRENQGLKENIQKLDAEIRILEMTARLFHGTKGLDNLKSLRDLSEAKEVLHEGLRAINQRIQQIQMPPNPTPTDGMSGLRPGQGVQNCNFGTAQMAEASPNFSDGSEVKSPVSTSATSSEPHPRATQIRESSEHVNNDTTARKLQKLQPPWAKWVTELHVQPDAYLLGRTTYARRSELQHQTDRRRPYLPSMRMLPSGAQGRGSQALR